jgi:hypothetical protein
MDDVMEFKYDSVHSRKRLLLYKPPEGWEPVSFEERAFGLVVLLRRKEVVKCPTS